MSDFKIVKLLDAPVQINLPTGPDFTGEYDNATSYSIGQSVSYNGSSYIALNATTGNPPPNTLFWQLLAEKGDKGDTGTQGPQGESYQESYETVSKNLKSWNASFNYSSGNLVSIVYTSGADTITKTFNYTGSNLTSIVLSGDTPSGINLTKNFNYTGSDLTSITYS